MTQVKLKQEPLRLLLGLHDVCTAGLMGRPHFLQNEGRPGRVDIRGMGSQCTQFSSSWIILHSLVSLRLISIPFIVHSFLLRLCRHFNSCFLSFTLGRSSFIIYFHTPLAQTFAVHFSSMLQSTLVALLLSTGLTEARVPYPAGVLHQRADDGLTLLPNAIQKGSFNDGSDEIGSAEVGQALSATSQNNFINNCAGKTLTNGLQITTGSCNGIRMSSNNPITGRANFFSYG